jgi:membrane protease YdiL (CAAX protease family)
MRLDRLQPTANHAAIAAFAAVWGLILVNGLAGPLFAWLSAAGASLALQLGANALVSEIGLTLPLVAVLVYYRIDLREGLGLGRFRLGPTLWSLLTIAGAGVLLDELMHLAVTALPSLRSGGLDAVGSAIASATIVESLILLVPLALLPGLCEEALCRGLVLRGLLTRFQSSRGWVAILLSALFFGLLHIDRLHAPIAALMGLVLGFIALRTGSLWAPIICHVVNNAVSLLTPALGGPSLSQVLDQGHSLPFVALGAAAFAAGIVGLSRSRAGATLEDEHQDGAADAHDGEQDRAEERARVLAGHEEAEEDR